MATAVTTSDRVTILWRGSLESCNYNCNYCPFSKRQIANDNLSKDQTDLARFVDWVESGQHPILDLFFTPWGEALIHRHYQDSLIRLSNCSRIRRIAIQTNGSGIGNWIKNANPSRLGFWISYHPTQTSPNDFLSRIAIPHTLGFQFTVGGVACSDTICEMEKMRELLPNKIPMWLNYKKPKKKYSSDLLSRIFRIDPHFDHCVNAHKSRGELCLTGWDTIAVNGDGNFQRCFFDTSLMGNIYSSDWQQILHKSSCTSRNTCDCFIGYVNIERLHLRSRYIGCALERMPHMNQKSSSNQVEE